MKLPLQVLGSVSSVTPMVLKSWIGQIVPLSGFFEVTIFSHAVGMVKPDPHIYQHACKNLGVAPSDCIFIGDGNSDELRGAAQVGMFPFCAAWFLRQHTDVLGEDIVTQRAAGYPVLYHPSELADRVRDICAGC